MSTNMFHPLPLEAYLRRGAGKARKKLHKEAFSRRIEHWQYSIRAAGLEEAQAAIEAQFGTTLEDLPQEVAAARLQYDIQLEIVMSFERQMARAQEQALAGTLAGQVLSASCTLAGYEVALYRAKKRLHQARLILGDRQAQAEAHYADLLAMDEVVQLRETVRVQLELRRRQAAGAFSKRIGTVASAKLRAAILAADLGEYEKDLCKALASHEQFKQRASYQARRLAEALHTGHSPYLAEAPPSSHSFVAYGSYVRALDKQGHTVARWAVAADGGAYLLKVLQPAGTRRIRREGQAVKAYDRHGQVLGSYPATAWLMRRPQRTISTRLAA